MNIAELIPADKLRRGITLPPVRESEGAIISYRVIMVGVLREIRVEAERSVIPAYREALPLVQDEAEWFESLKAAAAYATASAVASMGRLFRREGDRHAERFVRAIRSATRVDVPLATVTNPATYDAMMRVAIERNASLITSLSDGAVKRIEQQVYAARTSGLAARRSILRLRRDIREGLNVSRSRADLIASDQMASLNSMLAEHRAGQTGFTHYTWQTRGDNRVRERHQTLRGNVYRWGEPTGAEDGLPPGRPIRCRCTPVPTILGQKPAITSAAEQRRIEARNREEQRRIMARSRRRRAA